MFYRHSVASDIIQRNTGDGLLGLVHVNQYLPCVLEDGKIALYFSMNAELCENKFLTFIV